MKLSILITCFIVASCTSPFKNDKLIGFTERERDSLLREKKIRLRGINNDTLEVISDPKLEIKFTPIIPAYPDLGQEGVKLIENKLTSIISKYTVSGSAQDPSFALIPSINLTEKNITSSAPTLYANVYEITFYTVNIGDGTIFSSAIFTLKGIGTSSFKAFINAIQSKSLDQNRFKALLVTGQQKAFNYYESNCDKIIKHSKAEVALRNYSSAFSILKSIPSSVNCYDKIELLLENVFSKKMAQDCNDLYKQMKSELGKQSEVGGFNEKAMSLYALIPSDAPCHEAAEETYNIYLKKLDPNGKLKQNQNEWKNQFAITKAELEAKVAIDGQTELLQKYKSDHEYNKLPWLRKLVHLGEWDPFDATSKINSK